MTYWRLRYGFSYRILHQDKAAKRPGTCKPRVYRFFCIFGGPSATGMAGRDSGPSPVQLRYLFSRRETFRITDCGHLRIQGAASGSSDPLIRLPDPPNPAPHGKGRAGFPARPLFLPPYDKGCHKKTVLPASRHTKKRVSSLPEEYPRRITQTADSKQQKQTSCRGIY